MMKEFVVRHFSCGVLEFEKGERKRKNKGTREWT